MSRPQVVDFYGCSGMFADGLADAGWEVTCVDNNANALRHNPHHRVHGDALKLMRDRGFMRQFDAKVGSPPCQSQSATLELAKAQGRVSTKGQVNLIPQTLEAFRADPLPWVIENVERSQVKHLRHVRLCGSSFGLPIQRHRLFAYDGFQLVGSECHHETFPLNDKGKPQPWGVYHHHSDDIPGGGRTVRGIEHGHEVMGLTGRTVPWAYLKEGLPPAYGLWLGAQMLAQVEARTLTYADTLF